MYLTYEEYLQFGMSVPEDVFPFYERDAEYHLDNITWDRLKAGVPEKYKDHVSMAMAVTIDLLYKAQQSGASSMPVGNVTSYSNGVETISYDSSKSFSDELKKEVNKQAVFYLPVELTCTRRTADELSR